MSEQPTVPVEATAVARRYLRVERLVSGGVALGIGLLGGAAVIVLPLLWGLAIALGLLALARLPVFRSGGRARLRTDSEPETVRDDFTGATPPPLALQWGIADEVRAVDDGAVYELSYLFGLRSVTMRLDAERAADDRLELSVTAEGRAWGTYTVEIERVAGGTEVVVDVGSDRKFGLRRLAQYLVVRRYRDAALEAQGYEVLNREFSLSL